MAFGACGRRYEKVLLCENIWQIVCMIIPIGTVWLQKKEPIGTMDQGLQARQLMACSTWRMVKKIASICSSVIIRGGEIIRVSEAARISMPSS